MKPITFVTQLLTAQCGAIPPAGEKTRWGSLMQVSHGRSCAPVSRGSVGTCGSVSEEVSTTTPPQHSPKTSKLSFISLNPRRPPPWPQREPHHPHPKEKHGENTRDELDLLVLLVAMCVQTLPSASCRKALLLGRGSDGFLIFISYDYREFSSLAARSLLSKC